MSPQIPAQRRERLLSLLRRDGAASTRALQEALGVSHMTVRRDIAHLQEEGLVEPVPGGVRPTSGAGQQPPSARRQRAGLEVARKEAIAARAAALVQDGMALYLDAGTTCEALVPHLARHRRLTVVTNDFWSAIALLEHPHLETIHVGGRVDTDSASSCGALSMSIARAMRLDLFFLSTGAWSVEGGITAPSADRRALKQQVHDSSTVTALVADSTKYGAHAPYHVFDLDEIDAVITDEDLGPEARAQLAARDLALHIAET
ncbi:DeoR/GlpR family DNA-binding transcription regulator [Nocardioides insulae]|uniref:DeoR/GlpR family DNA-binding transcription regulator n=1 Tax=Nocardioides insulae TaxID=394734 RepID=UPI0003F5E4D6|nr:DeoR/GlpR family DNA-binding transcription regulator [Nocardioides insulae]